MIPKKIHYCWFGGNPLPELAKKCIASWKKYCPDYEIIEWNETNYKTDNVYFNQALDAKKWAFASDYARLDIIYNHGGVYLDTDVELLKSLDDLIGGGSYVGTEINGTVATGLGFAAEARNHMVEEMLAEYDGIKFIKDNGEYDTTPCPVRNMRPFERRGYKPSERIMEVGSVRVLTSDFFAPKNYLTRELRITNNSVSIHHYDGSWLSDEDKYAAELREKYKKIMPNGMARCLAKFIAVKRLAGMKSAIKDIERWARQKG